MKRRGRLRKTLRLMAGLCCVMALAPELARGQESPGDVRAQIPTVLLLDVANADPRFTSITAADFDAGYALPTNGASTLAHKGNVSHSVHIRADAGLMSGGDGDKPASDLQWSLDGGPWTPLTTSNAALVPGANRGSHAGRTVAFRLLLDFADDPPGTYTLNFTYTILAN